MTPEALAAIAARNEKPERTWIDWPQPNATGLAFSCQARPPAVRTEYIRADLVDAEVARLTAVIEHDRSKVVDVLAEANAVLKNYGWLAEGRGSYAFDDDRWKDEFKACMDCLEKVLDPMRGIASDLSDSPIKWADIVAARSMTAEKQEAEKLVYAPGLWHCPKCNFTLTQSNLNAADGTVTARDTPGDKCPNCQSPLWRVSWKQEATKAWEVAEQYFTEKKEADARIETLERLDREAATHVESLICMKTHFTGEPPYIGWKGLGLALREHLERQDARIKALEVGLKPFAKAAVTFADKPMTHPDELYVYDGVSVGVGQVFGAISVADLRHAASLLENP